jgi:hypothetical protein
MFIRVIIESPFQGNQIKHKEYLCACMHDCLSRNEAPFASHGLYTQNGVLDDNDSNERDKGIKAGFAWHNIADKMVVYTDLGVTSGMELGIRNAESIGLPVIYRELKEVDKSFSL